LKEGNVREKRLVLDNEYFFAKQQRYRIEDIERLYFYYVQTQKTVNFTAAGIDHDVVLRLYLKGQAEPISVNSLGHFRFGIMRLLERHGGLGMGSSVPKGLPKSTLRSQSCLVDDKKLDTTALYTRVAISALGQVTSPLDFLLKMPG
jgi:hypothetical protein